MSNHSSYPLDENEALKSYLSGIPNISPAAQHPLGLGATGKFPNGQITTTDEGEIQLGITVKDNVVVMDFGKPTHWVGFTYEQAMLIASTLVRRAQDLKDALNQPHR